MNMKIVLAGLLVVLMTTGSQCVNDGFMVAVNLPMSKTWTVKAGSATTFGGITPAIKLGDQIDASYANKIKSARYYDIRVSIGGTYTGNIDGDAYIIYNTTTKRLLHFHGTGTQFQTPQSLLGSSSAITPDPEGVNSLMLALKAFPTNPNTSIILSANGTVSPAPTSDFTVTVEVLAQVDAQVDTGS